MPNYDKLQLTTQNLIAKFGTDWTYRFVSKGTYNPSTNTRTIDSTTDTIVKAVRTKYNKNQIDGQIIQQGDVKLIVEANDTLTPTTEGKMVYNSEIWQIIDITKLQPATKTLLYEFQLRQ